MTSSREKSALGIERQEPPPSATRVPSQNTTKYAFMVGFGILVSRIFGLVRQRAFAHYLGISDAAGAFNAAFKIPNFLQNIFGEGALSASFIPVYARLLIQKDDKEASRVASAILTFLSLITALIVLVGIIITPYISSVIAPGFTGETRDLTIKLIRIFFPGAGLLVLSAWCLGVLNSHRRFLLAYIAPVAWNVAIIATLLLFGHRSDQSSLAILAAWGSVIGSALQFGVQLPTVWWVTKGFRLVLDPINRHVRDAIRNFIPVLMSRGVVQISALIDSVLASLISPQAVASLAYAQTLYTLPVSLFGMSVSAAELPIMASTTGTEAEVFSQLRRRLDSGLRRIAFFIVPSAMAMLALGDVLTSALYQSGEFTKEVSLYVWAILAGSAIGLLASTMGRLYASTYYALQDTRTPLVFAVVRVTLTTILGYLFAIHFPRAVGLDPKWGAVGLTASAGGAGWIEFVLLRGRLNKIIGQTGVPAIYLIKLWGAAIVGAAAGWSIKVELGTHNPLFVAAVVLPCFGVSYFAVTAALRVPELYEILGSLRRFTSASKH
jgi:putative peptidoglycan lipid II flippase